MGARTWPEHWEGMKEFLPGPAKASRGRRSGSNTPEAQAEGQTLKREPVCGGGASGDPDGEAERDPRRPGATGRQLCSGLPPTNRPLPPPPVT